MSLPVELETLGGLKGLREILSDFYQRVFNDPMIGYLFVNQDKKRLIERELEWTARLFGASDVIYQGRPLKKAHRAHPIRRGHFHRRNQLLKQTLIDRSIDQEIQERWMAHSESLINTILGKASVDSTCEQTSMEDSQHSPPSLSQQSKHSSTDQPIDQLHTSNRFRGDHEP